MCERGDIVHIPIGGRVCDIDRCISHIVAALNAGGLKTVACCCGHGHRPGSIILEDGRELIVMPDWDSARLLDPLYPDIHGERLDKSLGDPVNAKLVPKI